LLRAALVTGAGGFIGRAVMASLAARGVPVRGIERPDYSAAQDLTLADLTDPAAVRDAVAGAARDLGAPLTVFHLAGQANAGVCQNDPANAFAANVTATAALLEACRLTGLSRIVFPSTALVYAPSPGPLDERAPLAPRSLYGATKCAAEWLLRGSAADFGFSVDIARLGNVYGAGGPADSVVATLLRQLTRDGGARLKTLAPVRDFVHRDDAAEALVRLAEAGNEPGCRVFNVSSGVPTSIAELAEAARRAVGRGPAAVETEPGTGADDRFVLDVRRLRQRTGWTPGTTLADGLERTLAPIGTGQA
jgi:UDP-glucose 4-epimerase